MTRERNRRPSSPGNVGHYISYINKEEKQVEDRLVTVNETEVKRDCAQGKAEDPKGADPMIMEEYDIEELSVDGICGVY
jgi:mycofactocin precursor